jgi:outer membrane protein OmpA-like peptidoglycan-associated protein
MAIPHKALVAPAAALATIVLFQFPATADPQPRGAQQAQDEDADKNANQKQHPKYGRRDGNRDGNRDGGEGRQRNNAARPDAQQKPNTFGAPPNRQRNPQAAPANAPKPQMLNPGTTQRTDSNDDADARRRSQRGRRDGQDAQPTNPSMNPPARRDVQETKPTPPPARRDVQDTKPDNMPGRRDARDQRGREPGAQPNARPNFGNQDRSPGGFSKLDDLKKARKQRVEDGGKRTVIEEPDRRRIFKQDNRIVIQKDETARVRRVAPNARFEKRSGGNTIATVDRPGNVKIISETDANGQLIRRVRRDSAGREVVIIDNRGHHRPRKKNNLGRDIAIGAAGAIAGAAILNALVDVPPPRVTIPRDRYIMRYEGASEDDLYDALSAPPVDPIDDYYTLDEVRATPHLRDRMRRIDLDDINFAFGAWDVGPEEYRKLSRIARAMNRVIDRNPNEVFLIEGYTDAVGSREDNLTLSDRRAESVAEVLSEHFDVPFENLTTQGYGEDFLKVQTEAPERLNRRVAVRRITPLISDRRSSRGPGRPDHDRYDDRD